jgi:hypothetical protein
MTLQEFIDFDVYTRCYCVGRKEVLVMPYDPKNRRYLPREEHPLPQELEDRMIRDTILINEALGYDLNTVEFAVRDGIPYAIDFTNPAPDADIWSVTEAYHKWVVEAVARMLVDCALNGTPTLRYHRWNKWLNPEPPEPDFLSGAAQVAQSASAVLTAVIDEISEAVKPKRPRKATTEVKRPTKATKKSKRD